MVATLVADLLAWFLFLGAGVGALTITVVGTAHAHRNLQEDGNSGPASTVLAAGAAVLLFLGGWLFLGLYWLGAWTLRTIHRVDAG